MKVTDHNQSEYCRLLDTTQQSQNRNVQVDADAAPSGHPAGRWSLYFAAPRRPGYASVVAVHLRQFLVVSDGHTRADVTVSMENVLVMCAVSSWELGDAHEGSIYPACLTST